MKAIQTNLWQHENGYFYIAIRRGNKLHRQSLKTKSLAEAKRVLAERALKTSGSPQEENKPAAAVPPPAPLPPNGGVAAQDCSRGRTELKIVLEEYCDSIPYTSYAKEQMYKGARKVVEKYGEPLVCELKPVAIWNKYRRKGLDGRGEVTSAANHLRTFLRQFADWAVREGYLPERVKKEVDGIPLVKINSRRLTPPSGKVVDEYLKMIESEDHLGGQYLRFLATTGLRLSGGLRLSWDRIDLERKEIEAVMKGGRVETLPLTEEALEVLRERKKQAPTDKCPFPLSERKIRTLRTKMKKFAKGFGIDLNTIHMLRHYFSTKCLMSGFTVQEVGQLLGHADEGQLVLKTYGHVCDTRLRGLVHKLKLTSDDDAESEPN